MDSSQLAQPPVFILSCPRSGSTLLRYIVDTHPVICSPAELSLGQLCAALFHTISGSLGQILFKDEEERRKFAFRKVNEIVNEIMMSYVKQKGKQRWCEKTPGHFEYLNLLARVFPYGQYICLHRNCMDVVHSLLELTRFNLDETLLTYYHRRRGNTVAAMIEYWIENTNTLLDFQEKYPGTCLQVKYELLVSNPQEEVARIFEFLGVDGDGDILQKVFLVAHDRGRGDPNILFATGLRSDTVGKGSGLPLWNIDADLLGQMNSTLSRLQYPPISSDWNRIPNPNIPSQGPLQSAGENIPAEKIFNLRLQERLKNAIRPFPKDRINCRLIVTGSTGGEWLLGVNNHALHVNCDHDHPIDCTIWVSADNFMKIVNGTLHPASAFIEGKVSITGDSDVAIAMGKLLFGLEEVLASN
jgi:hypothetical protein